MSSLSEAERINLRDRHSAATFMHITLSAARAQAHREGFDGLLGRLDDMRREMDAVRCQAAVALAGDREDQPVPLADALGPTLIRAGAEW